MSSTVAYLTKRFPRLSETFILDEILGLEEAGVPLRLYAVADPGEPVVQPDVTRVKSPVVYLRRHGVLGRAGTAAATLAAQARLVARSPRRYLAALACAIGEQRSPSGLLTFAKGGHLAVRLEADGARHVHAAFAHGPATLAHVAHLLTGIPFSFAAHAKDLYLSEPGVLARKAREASFVLTCSEQAASAMRALAGEAVEGKIVLAPHGVDSARFAPPAPRRSEAAGRAVLPLRVLAVGRLVAKKGYPVLLESLAALERRGSPVSCSIVGEGPDRVALQALAAELGISSRLRLCGARTHQETALSYRGADAFVQTSVVLQNGDRDGTPNSLLEAMASGLAVVASDIAGVREVVAPGCGLLVPPGDPVALASALERLASDPELRARLGGAARQHVLTTLERARCVRAITPLFLEEGGETAAAPAALGR